jgi:hypothetical protein
MPNTNAAALQLSAQQPLRLTGARGIEVVAVAGTVWITADGDAGDFFLAAGERYRVTTRRLVLVEAIGAARVRLETPDGRLLAAARRRLAPLFRRLQDKMRRAIPPARTDPA